MGRKTKIFENVSIETVASEGKCAGRIDGMVVFVEATAPGDIVDVKVTRKKRTI